MTEPELLQFQLDSVHHTSAMLASQLERLTASQLPAEIEIALQRQLRSLRLFIMHLQLIEC